MVKIAQLLNLKMPLVLASGSPRRRQLLESLGFEFEVVPSDIDESTITHNQPEVLVQRLAYAKALASADKVKKPSLVIGADTIVVLHKQVFSKPTDKEDAIKMLKTLSGRMHIVYTGIAIVDSSTKRYVTDLQKTIVQFRELEDKEIEAYVESGAPLDKAGAYGIQDDFGSVFIRDIQGCYYNIVGLPLEMLYNRLRQFLK